MNRNEWWGYSQEHGWVVLDRNLAANQRDGSRQILFVRCSGWSVFKEERKHWAKPKYIAESMYISKLPFAEAKKAIEEVRHLKSDYRERRHDIDVQHAQSNQRDINAIIEKHEVFLALSGKQPGSYKAAGEIPRNRRITHCFSCKTHLDNIHDLECSECGWIVCENCGACGCGYKK